MFGPSSRRYPRLLRPLLPSAIPSRRLATPVAHLSRRAGRQTSQGKTRDLRAIYLSHLRPPHPGCIGLRASWLSRPGADASYALPVRQAGTLLAASFGSRIAPDTLAVRLAVPTPRARRGLPPPSHRPATTPAKRCLTAPRAMPGAQSKIALRCGTGRLQERQSRILAQAASAAATLRPRALLASTSVMRWTAPRSSSFSTTAISRAMRSSAAS